MRPPRPVKRRILALLPVIAAILLSAMGTGAQGPAPAPTRVYLAALERGEINAEEALTFYSWEMTALPPE